MLTGNKDVDRKILNNLEDEDLVNVCQVNKKAQSLCNDQVFWMNRVFLKFGYVGGDILRKNKKDRTWSEYYIKDIRKINSTNAGIYLEDGSYRGRLDHVIISLNIGANIHRYNDIALRYSSGNGHLEIVKYLVELKPDGANIHANDDLALRNSSGNGHLEIVKYLVELKPDGANIHVKDDEALRLASYYGHLDIVRYLVELKPDGANIHARDDSSLIHAGANGHLDVVKYLVENGANIHADDNDALRLASEMGHIEVVKYLVSQK